MVYSKPFETNKNDYKLYIKLIQRFHLAKVRWKRGISLKSEREISFGT